MCGLEFGRALKGLEGFGGYPVLEKNPFFSVLRDST
jgi:hypothetical protein